MSRAIKCAMCGQSPFATTQRDDAQARAENAQRETRMEEATRALWQKRALSAETQRDDLLDAATAAEKFIFDDTCRHDSEKAPVLASLSAAIAKARGTK